ncbi:MAG: response regulator [Sediminibacterium sp.]
MENKTLHILLADDDQDDCELFQEALAEIPVNAQLTIVNNGKLLMEWLTEHPSELPDLLFLDLNMPCKNGLECLNEIRRVHYLKSLAIIILSLTVNHTLVDELYTNGALYYVQKPNSVEALTQIIQQALSMLKEKKWVQRSRQDFVMRSSN